MHSQGASVTFHMIMLSASEIQKMIFCSVHNVCWHPLQDDGTKISNRIQLHAFLLALIE